MKSMEVNSNPENADIVSKPFPARCLQVVCWIRSREHPQGFTAEVSAVVDRFIQAGKTSCRLHSH
jgi:hypothetical protein